MIEKSNSETRANSEELKLPPVEISFTPKGIIITFSYRAKDIANQSKMYVRKQSFALPSEKNESTVKLRPYLGYLLVREEDPETFVNLLDSIIIRRRDVRLNKVQKRALLTIINEITKLTRRFDNNIVSFAYTKYSVLKTAEIVGYDQKPEQFVESANQFVNFLSSFFQETDYLDRFTSTPENVSALRSSLEAIYQNPDFVSRVLMSLGIHDIELENEAGEENTKKIVELESKASELNNILEDWIGNPEYPSSMYIREIHKAVVNGEDYSSLGLIPQSPGDYRTTDVRSSSKSEENFYVPGMEVRPLMEKYSDHLDQLLRRIKPINENSPSAESELRYYVHFAAWAYYTFIRIHPFLDGSGRTGREILQRVLKGAGLLPISFHSLYAPQNRIAHLDSLFAVDSELHLWPLVMYILLQLREQYKNNQPESKFVGYLENQINASTMYLPTFWRDPKESNAGSLNNIWVPFTNIDLDGSTDKNQEYQIYKRNLMNYIRAYHS